MRNTLIAAMAACMPFALAAAPNHTFIDAGYVNLDGDLDGVGVKGAVAVHPRLHAYAEFDRVEDGALTADAGALALGLNQPVTANTDLVARVGWARTNFDAGVGPDASDDGVMGQLGVRSALSDALEVNSFIRHADLAGADPSLSIGGVFGFTPALGVSGDVEFDEDDTAYRVGLRWSFGA